MSDDIRKDFRRFIQDQQYLEILGLTPSPTPEGIATYSSQAPEGGMTKERFDEVVGMLKEIGKDWITKVKCNERTMPELMAKTADLPVLNLQRSLFDDFMPNTWAARITFEVDDDISDGFAVVYRRDAGPFVISLRADEDNEVS